MKQQHLRVSRIPWLVSGNPTLKKSQKSLAYRHGRTESGPVLGDFGVSEMLSCTPSASQAVVREGPDVESGSDSYAAADIYG